MERTDEFEELRNEEGLGDQGAGVGEEGMASSTPTIVPGAASGGGMVNPSSTPPGMVIDRHDRAPEGED